MKQTKAAHKTELLAPAGSPEAFYGAIHAGADAVYLGGTQFGARAYATNFTQDELVECIKYAHREKRKVYLTVNTLLKENELSPLCENLPAKADTHHFPQKNELSENECSLLYDYLLPYYEAGLNGVIVQDLGVLTFIHKAFPDLPIHASTQMSQTGIHGIQLLQELGVTRVIPARELSLEELKFIKENTQMEIEVFIHGAMCYSYSGQCLFSSILGGRSGNRGSCAQPCRLPYKSCIGGHKSKDAYLLSLKDLYALPLLPQLLEIVIDSLKIEGRMKKPEYSAGVTEIYRKYLDMPSKDWTIAPQDQETLTKLYMRSEQQTGYLQKRCGREMVTLSGSAYKETDEALLRDIRSRISFSPKKKIVTMFGSFLEGQAAVLTVMWENFSGTAEGKIVAPARTQPTSRQSVLEQLSKLGGTNWEVGEIQLEMGDSIFLAVQEMKELRRKALAALEEQLNTRQKERMAPKATKDNPCELLPKKTVELWDQQNDLANKGLTILLTTEEQIQALLDHFPPEDALISGVYLDGDLCLAEGEHLGKTLQRRLLKRGIPVFLALPPILRRNDEAFLSRCKERLQSSDFAGCLVRSLEGYGYFRDLSKPIITDHFLPAWNSETLGFWQGRAKGVTIPLELNKREQIQLWKEAQKRSLPLEKIVYGRIPMMVSANCIANTMGKCAKEVGHREHTELIDRMNKRFPVRLICDHCTNIIYNSVPLSLHKEIPFWKEKVTLRLDFTVETKQETAQVLQWAYQGFPNGLSAEGLWEYTTGHESRGVM
jgi:putative protease